MDEHSVDRPSADGQGADGPGADGQHAGGQRRIRVAVVFGGRSSEHAISCASAA